MASPLWKPERRVRDSGLLRLLHADPAKECCLCGTTEALELHHVYPRGQQGGDTRSNLVWLCGDHHRQVTANSARVCALLGEHLLEARWDTLDYVISLLGEETGRDWLCRRLFVECA